MHYIAYKITCAANGKAYIGVTHRPLHKRWLAHIRDARTSDCVLYRAMRRYGVRSFSVCVIAEAASAAELFVLERGLIAEHGTYAPGGFNMTSGGRGLRAAIVTPDAIRRRSERIKETYANPVLRQEMSRRGKERFSNPGERERQRALAITFARTDKFRGEASARQIVMFKDPVYVARLRRGAAVYWTPERRAELGRTLTAARLRKVASSGRGQSAQWEVATAATPAPCRSTDPSPRRT